ncbi:MAG: EboA domain-containing protein [Planctomycetota bacterium]
METGAILLGWLERRLAPEGWAWLRDLCGAVAAGAPPRRLFLGFSAVSRHTGKAPLEPTPEERVAADRARPGLDPRPWTVDQAGRIALVLHLPADERAPYVATLDRLFGAADLGELVALHAALPLLPYPEAHRARCAEGVRTNMTDVFKAVAHHNPYPGEQLDERAWNQMVLKALFVGVALDPIHGLDARANPRLARMLCDYAHERWSARRPVSPELWRCVGPHADDTALEDLERVLTTKGDEDAVRAAALALRACPRPEAAALLERHPIALPEGFDWHRLAEGIG